MGNKVNWRASAELPVGKLYRYALKGMLTVAIALLGVCGMAQGYKEKMATLVARGDSLRLNAASNHAQIRQVGLEGMRMADRGRL